MPQFARPNSTISTGTWTAVPSGSTLHGSIAEAAVDDATYDQSAQTPANDTFEVVLGALATPDFTATDVVSDTFTRANSTTPGSTETGQPWTVHSGAFAIDANRLTCTATGRMTVDSGTANATASIQFNVGADGTGRDGALIFRYVDANNYFYAYWYRSSTGSGIELYRRSAGTDTNIGGYYSSVGASTWHTIAVDYQGSAIAVSLDGTARISVTDTAHQSGTRIGVDGSIVLAVPEPVSLW
jgi:hypothetical protein